MWSTADKYSTPTSFIDGILQRLYPHIKESKLTANMRRQFDIPMERITKGVNGGYYFWRDISDVKMSLLTGPMGGGKTFAIIEWLRRNVIGTKKRVLWMTPRITLSADTKGRLAREGMNFENYKEICQQDKQLGLLDHCQFVICSVQPLHLLRETFDVVVTDEIETILYAFEGNAKCVNDVGLHWNALKYLIDQASKVFMMDALTTKTTFNFAKSFVEESQLEAFKTSTPPTKRTLRLVKSKVKAENGKTTDNSFDVWLAMIYEALKRGEKLYVFSANKGGGRGVEAIAQVMKVAFGWTEGKQVLTYFAEKEAEKRELVDANGKWGNPEVRLVVTNSAISVGVNFDLREVFHQIYCFWMPRIDA